MASDLEALEQRREKRSFGRWESVAPELVAMSETIVRQLVDRLIDLGPDPSYDEVQREVTRCVRQFNGLDRAWKHRWICTAEREDIGEVLDRLFRTCGRKPDAQLLAERDW